MVGVDRMRLIKMRGYAMRALVACALVVSAFLATMPSAQAEPVAVRAAPHDGFARVVFDWSDPVGYSADIQDGTLLVLFDRPIEADYARVLRALGPYVSSADVGPMSVAFPLKANYTLRTFVTGTSVVVDLVDPGASAPSADAVPSVRVRSGEHDRFSRIVFDWSGRVDYQVEQNGGQARITFSERARLNTSGLARRPARNVSSITVGLTDTGSEATLAISPGAELKHFRAGTKVVVDVGGTPTAATQTPPTVTPATPEPQVAAKPADEAPAPPAQPKPAVTEAPAATPPTPTAPAPAPVSLAPPTGAEATPATASTPAATTPAPAASEPPSADAPGDAIKGVEMRFDWNEPVAAAVFRRGENLWVVFDSHQKVDVAALRAKGGSAFHDIEQIANKRATVLKMSTVTGINPTLKRDGFSWTLDFKVQPLEPTTPIEANAQPNSPVGARVFLSVAEPSRAVALHDPDVGDNLVVVPVIPLNHGMLYEYNYPQVRLLATGQGIVIRPLIDALRVRSLRQGVEVTSTDILHVSSVSVEEQAVVRTESKETFLKPLTRIFDLEKWKRGDLQDFVRNKQRLQMAVARAKGDAREKARMDLAKFYFANSFEAEALGILRLVEADRPEVSNDVEFRALRGATNLLMGRLGEADGDLSHASLNDYDEGLFWRSVLQASRGGIQDAAGELMRTGAITRPYPGPLKMPLGTLVAEAAVVSGDVSQAAHFLEVLNLADPTPGQKSQLDYVEGQLKELSGEFQAAVGLWERVEDGNHRPTRAKAILARADLLKKMGKYDNKQMIGDLERLRFSWRGDDFEFNLLQRLGLLYQEEGDYREALRAYRQAATYYREHERVADVTKAMTDLFRWLYLEEGADALSPVTAIALYDEFRELTPAGEMGDEMIRRLADRLVEVDLLDRGARLLATQVEFRLKDEEKARVGARLALVYILNQRYQDAVAILEKTEHSGLEGDLLDQRRHLMARAQIGMNKGGDALALLEDDENLEADMLRAEIYWNSQDWRNAGKVLRRLLRASGARASTQLTSQQAQYVLNLAIAYTLSADERSLIRLRQDYGAAMDQSELKDAFGLIAAPESYGLIDHRSITERVKLVEDFQDFMGVYRQRIKEEKLSGIN